MTFRIILTIIFAISMANSLNGKNLTDLVSAIIGGILIYGIWNWL
jgi:hypothetical protein